MKILIIGHSVLDHIHQPGDEKIAPGGIFYSTMGLKSFSSPDDEISLLTYLDKDNGKYFSFLYEKLNGIYIKYVDKIPVVHLKHFENEERCEWYENITINLDIKILQNLNDLSGILINMITGFDITVNDLAEIREKYKGLIYLDIHTLSRGMGENNQRIFRVIPEVKDWLSNVDVVQVNESELLTLDESKVESEIVNKVFGYGIKVLIVTSAEEGGRVYYKENDEVMVHKYTAEKTRSINKIGCGDIFGSVFFYTYINSLDVTEAVNLAKAAAACVTEYGNIHDFENLKDDTVQRLN